MLTRILHNSPSLCTFVEQLDLSLSKPQQQHVINLVDGLLVCEGPKTLAALQREFVECVDVSNMADTLRIAPWTANDLQEPVGAFLVHAAVAQARACGKLKYITISLDDSLAHKHKHTRHLEGVDWHYDHLESTPKQPRYANGLAYLACHLCIGGIAVTFAVRPYLREKTVRRLNRLREPDTRIPFRSKFHVAREILQVLYPLLPTDIPIFVLHDEWYASARLMRWTHRQAWYTITALKRNRKLNCCRLDQHTQTARHQRYEQVTVTATDGTPSTYFTRTFTGRLEDLAFEVRVIDSKRHPRAPRSAYFGCTALHLKTQTALQIYGQRWGCETDNVYLHTRLGLGDFRVRPYEAIAKWMAVTHLSLAHLQWRLMREQTRTLPNLAAVIRQHRDEHARDWLTGACQEAIATGDLTAVLNRYLAQDA
jgi:hypothetical protein